MTKLGCFPIWWFLMLHSDCRCCLQLVTSNPHIQVITCVTLKMELAHLDQICSSCTYNPFSIEAQTHSIIIGPSRVHPHVCLLMLCVRWYLSSLYTTSFFHITTEPPYNPAEVVFPKVAFTDEEPFATQGYFNNLAMRIAITDIYFFC